MYVTLRTVRVFISLLAFAAASVSAQLLPSLTILNGSGEIALVKVVGPSEAQASLQPGASQKLTLFGGEYLVKIRYGTAGGYHYAKCGPFRIVGTSTRVGRASLTLRSVSGNLHETRISPAEFAH